MWRIEKARLVEEYRERNKTCEKGQIVFAGSSLMEMFPIEKWIKETDTNVIVYNRGVGGYKTEDMLPILDACVLGLEPRRVFINIGTNDLSDDNISMEQVMDNYDKILSIIEKELPQVEIYLMAYYPVNYEAATEDMKACLKIRNNKKINLANELVKELAKKHGQKYIDVNAPLKDQQGNLKAEYTIEGMHIKPEGYRAIFPEVMKYVQEPAWR